MVPDVVQTAGDSREQVKGRVLSGPSCVCSPGPARIEVAERDQKWELSDVTQEQSCVGPKNRGGVNIRNERMLSRCTGRGGARPEARSTS